MEFSSDKCEVSFISRQKNPIICLYKLHNIELKTIENAKYLGIKISHDFNWKSHMETGTSKATNILKFV